MGRTIPSFRYAMASEESAWSVYRNSLAKSRKVKLDIVFAVPRMYLSACSAALQSVVIDSILMSNIFHDYLRLESCIEQVEAITGDRFNEPIAA